MGVLPYFSPSSWVVGALTQESRDLYFRTPSHSGALNLHFSDFSESAVTTRPLPMGETLHSICFSQWKLNIRVTGSASKTAAGLKDGSVALLSPGFPWIHAHAYIHSHVPDKPLCSQLHMLKSMCSCFHVHTAGEVELLLVCNYQKSPHKWLESAFRHTKGSRIPPVDICCSIQYHFVGNNLRQSTFRTTTISVLGLFDYIISWCMWTTVVTACAN